jgi:hypothetical protein
MMRVRMMRMQKVHIFADASPHENDYKPRVQRAIEN